MIHGLAPESVRKQLVNVRKTLERNKKRRAESGDKDSEDEETQERFNSRPET